MSEPLPEPAPKPYGEIYRALQGRSRAAEPGVALDDADIVRFCQCLGAFPKSWTGAKASGGVRAVIERMADATGATPEEVRADLAQFCADGNPRALCTQRPACAECPVAEHCEYPDRRPTIKDMPETQRPRERLIESGAETLSDIELLAIIIGGGSPKATALDLANRLLTRYDGFRRLARATTSELTTMHGIGPAKAARIQAALGIARRYASEDLSAGMVIRGSKEVYAHMREQLAGEQKEFFCTLLLDTKNHLIDKEWVAVGSLNESVVHPREAFQSAVSQSAAKVIFVHNHPSGNPEPSQQDRRLTRRLREVGSLLGIPVLDHLIIGREDYYSFAEAGALGDSR
ncbi:MAG: DNA repair protein RadC [Candidatus Brocadiia bacterium]